MSTYRSILSLIIYYPFHSPYFNASLHMMNLAIIQPLPFRSSLKHKMFLYQRNHAQRESKGKLWKSQSIQNTLLASVLCKFGSQHNMVNPEQVSLRNPIYKYLPEPLTWPRCFSYHRARTALHRSSFQKTNGTHGYSLELLSGTLYPHKRNIGNKLFDFS